MEPTTGSAERGHAAPSPAQDAGPGRGQHALWLAAGLAATAVGALAWWTARPVPGPTTSAVAPAATIAPPAPGPAPAIASGTAAQLGAAAAATARGLDSATEVIVRRDDTLDGIFRRLQLSVEDLAAVRSLPGIRQSLDILRPGDVIKLTHLNGELTSLQRRVSDTQTLNVERNGTGDFDATFVANALDVRVEPLHGRIESSLFKSVNDVGASDGVALQLAEVFRYDVDFAQELQPGDEFTVVLEKVWRDGAFLRDGDILAAEFVNDGRTYRAVRYRGPDGRAEYYTPDGKALRKAFLLAPVQFSRISSGFGVRWHPVLNRVRAHKGIDYAAAVGTPVRAAGAGRVEFRGVQGGYGNVIVLQHANDVETVYGHLSRFAAGVYLGKRVQQGELIGYVGMTGLATGPHLHYEYRVNGVHRNPASLKTAPAEPIPATLRADFDAQARTLLAQLDAARHTASMTAAQ